MTKKEQKRLQVEANNLIRANQKIEREEKKQLLKEAYAKKLLEQKAATAKKKRLAKEASLKKAEEKKAASLEKANQKAIAKLEAVAKKERDNERLFDDRMDQEFRYFRFLKWKIEELIKRGESNKFIIDAVFYNVRNAPFEIGCTPLFNLKFMPKPAIANTKEHINGRTTFGVTAATEVCMKAITTKAQLSDFYRRYDVYIYTDDNFNSVIIKPLQQNGAISADTYIEKYEAYFGPLLDEQKLAFKDHFIHTKYGSPTREGLIELMRGEIEKEKPKQHKPILIEL